MSCLVEQRQRAQELAATLDADPRVLATGVLAPEDDPTDCWAVEAHLRGRTGGVPADILAGLAVEPTIRCQAYNGSYRALFVL